MITGLDHVVLLCPDINAGIKAYQTLLGSEPVWRSEDDGMAMATFAVYNTCIELVAPRGDSTIANKLRRITDRGAKLTSLVYRVDGIAECRDILLRRGLDPSRPEPTESQSIKNSDIRKWKRFRVPDEKMAGVKSFFIQHETRPLSANTIENSAVKALDNVVIDTPNSERAIANYCGRLGLRFALERTSEQWKTKFLFIRLGSVTLEVIQRMGVKADPQDDDAIWGLTWEVADIDAARRRLRQQGVSLSDIRKGRAPNSRVFTVQDNNLNIPTLFIEHANG